MIRYILERSMKEDKVVSIIYLSDKGFTQRDIIVHSIEGDKVYGYCFLREQWRSFKIENILSAFFPKTPYNKAS